MGYIYIGKIVNTHGIKGELKIISNFEHKELVFKKDVNIYIGNNYQKEKIVTYRHHKNYEMITLEGYNNINEVLKFKNNKVYVNRGEINSFDDIILKSDIIGMSAYIMKEKIGVISDIYSTGNNYEVFEVKNNTSKKLIPYHKDFIESIDKENNTITFKKGMI